MNELVQEIEREFLKKEVPDFRPGDSIRVAVRIVEGDKERIQNFEGLCIGRHGSGMSETFMVRRVSFGVGMERVFTLHSPRIESITVLRQGRVRRSKLFYLRELSGRKARIADTRRKRLARGTMLDVTMPEEANVEAATEAEISAAEGQVEEAVEETAEAATEAIAEATAPEAAEATAPEGAEAPTEEKAEDQARS